MEYKKFSTFIDSVQYGYTADETSTVEGDAKYLRITDIVPYFVDKDRVPFCKISDKNRIKYLVTENDLLIARTGATTGYNLIVPKGFDNYVFASYLVRFNYNQDELYPQYLKHVLKSQQYYGFVKNYIGGSAQPGMNPKAFGRFEVPHVEYDKQKRIAEILSAYDDLIENNNRRIALLEKAAQELYKEWFVRFRFPGYENAKFENGLPEGWERTTFEKIASFQNGYAFKSNELLDSAEPNTYEVFKQGHIKRGGGFKAEGTKSWYHKSLCTGLQKFVLHKKDVLMAMTDMKDNVAILGNTAIMPYDNRYILNQRVGLLRPTHYRETDFAYIHLLTNSYDFVQDLRSRANRGVQVNLSAVQIRESETVVPSEIINKKFAEIMDPIFEEIFNIMIQSENLVKQRDLLLPRLMSGKLEV